MYGQKVYSDIREQELGMMEWGTCEKDIHEEKLQSGAEGNREKLRLFFSGMAG